MKRSQNTRGVHARRRNQQGPDDPSRKDLPVERTQWDSLFLGALGSPDPYLRQLDGMGGGLSSLSKVCIIGPPTRPDADVDYTFAQVLVDRGACIDWRTVRQYDFGRRTFRGR